MIRATSLEVPYRTAFTNGTHAGVSDVPIEKGGDGHGFGPHELLEAALATCLTITVRKHAAKHEWPLERVDCAVRIDRSIPNVVALHFGLTLEGPLTSEQTEQLWDAASLCPVARTLTGSIALQRATMATA